ncbi:MAG: hypothetical protein ACYSW6_09735 [Planctomycetota bacterium]
MADLIDRISGQDETRPKLLIEQFVAGLELYALGLKTKFQVSQDWDLQGQEQSQANAIATAVDSAVGLSAKLQLLAKIRAISSLVEMDSDTIYHNQDGTVNKALVISDMGI